MISKTVLKWAGLLALGAFQACVSRTLVYPPLGEDAAYEGEQEDILESVKLIREMQESIYKKNPQQGKKRGAHAKGLGCALAKLEPIHNPENTNLNVGIFAEKKIYSGVVRFSNSSPEIAEDFKTEPRGLALKLFGVKGEKLFSENQTSYGKNTPDSTNAADFALTTLPIFPAQTVADYNSLVSHKSWYLLTHPSLALRVKGVLPTNVTSVFAHDYHSMGALKWGKAAAKIRLKSCKIKNENEKPMVEEGNNMLKEDINLRLKQEDQCFFFQVQIQKDSKEQPTEDASVIWNETDTPFISIAKLSIPKQDSSLQDAKCEQLRFNPWRTLPAHRPLGSLNRARKVVYEASATYRNSK